MSSADLVRTARRRCGLTQRDLARQTGIAQPTIARIETGRADPMISTVERLLRACGSRLQVEELEPGYGIDRTQFHELLKLTHAERLAKLEGDAAGMSALIRAVRRR